MATAAVTAGVRNATASLTADRAAVAQAVLQRIPQQWRLRGLHHSRRSGGTRARATTVASSGAEQLTQWVTDSNKQRLLALEVCAVLFACLSYRSAAALSPCLHATCFSWTRRYACLVQRSPVTLRSFCPTACYARTVGNVCQRRCAGSSSGRAQDGS